MVDYDLLQEIADKLKTVEDWQVRMDIVRLNESSPKPCGCIAGWAQILFGLWTMEESADLLGLAPDEATYVFQGLWHPKFQWWSGKITRHEVIQYLEKAISERNVYVTI